MLFAVIFEDRPDHIETRNAWLPAHLEWLAQHREQILVAGSLREDPQCSPAGGLWIVEMASRAEIVKLIESDPFWLHGLRSGYRVAHWSKAFPGLRVPI
jgi:hypothetical protein